MSRINPDSRGVRTGNAPGTARGWFERKALKSAARVELPDSPEAGAAGPVANFESWPDQAEIAMGKKDASVRRDRRLRKSRRPRLRAARRRILATALKCITLGRGARWASSTNEFIKVREEVGHLVQRDINDRTNRFRKFALGAGETIGLTLAYSIAMDLSTVEALLLALGSAVAFIIAGDVGKEAKYVSDRQRLSRHPESVPAKYHHLVNEGSVGNWLRMASGAVISIFVLAAISVGLLRGSDGDGLFIPVSFSVLSLAFMVAAALTSWGHASLLLPPIEFWREESEQDERGYKSSAKAKVLRQHARDMELVALHKDRADAYADARGHFADAARYTMRTNNPQVFGYGKNGDSRPTDEASTSLWIPPSTKESNGASSSPGNGEVSS